MTIAEASGRGSQNLARRFQTVQILLRLSPADSRAYGHVELAESKAVDASDVGVILGASAGRPHKLGELYGRINRTLLDRTVAIGRGHFVNLDGLLVWT